MREAADDPCLYELQIQEIHAPLSPHLVENEDTTDEDREEEAKCHQPQAIVLELFTDLMRSFGCSGRQNKTKGCNGM